MARGPETQPRALAGLHEGIGEAHSLRLHTGERFDTFGPIGSNFEVEIASSIEGDGKGGQL
jgi:hypothetical protein